MRQMYKELSDLANEVSRRKDAIRDINSPVRDMEFLPTGKLMIGGKVNARFAINDHAHGQIAEFAAIPRDFYGRIRASHPSLLANTLNTLIQTKGDESRFVRTLDGTTRAVVSPGYRALDNYDLLKAIIPVFGEHPELQFVSTGITDRRMYLKIISHKLEGEVKRGDVVRAGVLISNSEVRAGAILVSPFSERLSCTNGATHTDLAFRRSHIGRGFDDEGMASEFFKDETRRLADAAFFAKVRDIVEGFLKPETLNRILDNMRAAEGEKIEGNPIEAVDAVSATLSLTAGEKGDVLRNLIEGANLSRAGLANAITRTAQDAPDYDRASELERLGGEMFGAKNLDVYLKPGKRSVKSRVVAAATSDEFGVFN